MARLPITRCRRVARGFSLIELLVSITIGLVVVIAAMSAYLGSADASKAADAQARMNEDAQAALNLLTQQLRLAASNPVNAGRADAFRHNPVFDTTYIGGTTTAYGSTTTIVFGSASYTLTPMAIVGCDGTFGSITTTTGLLGLGCTTDATKPDSVAVSYEADRYNTQATAGGLPTDCVGGTLPQVTATFPSSTPTTATWAVADNRFYIANASNGVPNLYCKGRVSNTQPMVENVEDLQLRYGVISTTAVDSTATVAGYLDASGVEGLTALTARADRWGKVLTVRICVVVRSENPVAPDTTSASYVKCDGNVDTSKTDLRLRRAYSTTVVLRNRRS